MKSSFNTASGRYCCNLCGTNTQFYKLKEIVSIPQAVGTVATISIDVHGEGRIPVSIPQAVGTVATISIDVHGEGRIPVSIPQAVGTVATIWRN